MSNVPMYELVITDDDITGVDYVALVDHPAIERNWMAFANKPFEFKVANEDKRVVMGPLMVADQPIIRVDQRGQFYVVFSAPTIEKIVRRFMKNGYSTNVNQMHNANQVADGCYMLESFIIDTKMGKHTPDNFATLPNGSWFGSYAIDNDAVWQKVKEGKFKGFSVEGFFDEVERGDIDERLAEELIQTLIEA